MIMAAQGSLMALERKKRKKNFHMLFGPKSL